MSVENFRTELKREVQSVCATIGKNYDKAQDRGYAFEIWLADLLIRMQELDFEAEEHVFKANDLKVDIAFDDEEAKLLCLAQAKFVSLSSNPDIEEGEVNDFFKRNDIFTTQRDWVREHSSDQLWEYVADYPERMKTNWNTTMVFVSTGKASERIKELVRSLEIEARSKNPNLTFLLYDFYGLKELYVQSHAIEATIAEYVDIQFGRNYIVRKSKPHDTILTIVKGNTLVSLYKKYRDSLFAYNIRSFLGKRVNKEMVQTAVSNPQEFYYFNNGVSAVCTDIDEIDDNTFRFHQFQVINGAQTLGSLASVGNLSPDCEVILRITQGNTVKTEKGFNADIIRYNNTQNVVRASDFRSNDKIQLWLEDKFNKLRPRGAVEFPLRYVRKRSFQRVRSATPIKLEEFAKIRYAFIDEPTRCIADPRSLWTTSEDGGFYEKAFGVDGHLHDSWTEPVWNDSLLSVVISLACHKKINQLIKENRSEFFFLQRLRYWMISLAVLHISIKNINKAELLTSSAKFSNWFDAFWRDVIRDLVAAYQAAQKDRISNFALVRSETRWQSTRKQFELVLKAV